jgi:CRISPR/Cas system-associated exonuclease Cas4 (RecB family)
MTLTPLDIASYIYCPILYNNKRQDLLSKPLTFFESYIRAALIEGERDAMLRNTSVTPKRLMRAWDKVWWPAVAKKGLSMTKADKLTLKATEILTDYAQYDLSGYVYPTAGVYIGKTTPTIQATTDILKIHATAKEKNTVLVNFTRRKLDAYQSALDPAVKCTAYMFYMNNEEAVSHINAYIDTDKNKLKLTVSRFLPEDMEEIKKMLYHVEQGIASKVFYPNPYACKGCEGCKSSQS